jgi:hypothetical protein
VRIPLVVAAACLAATAITATPADASEGVRTVPFVGTDISDGWVVGLTTTAPALPKVADRDGRTWTLKYDSVETIGPVRPISVNDHGQILAETFTASGLRFLYWPSPSASAILLPAPAGGLGYTACCGGVANDGQILAGGWVYDPDTLAPTRNVENAIKIAGGGRLVYDDYRFLYAEHLERVSLPLPYFPGYVPGQFEEYILEMPAVLGVSDNGYVVGEASDPRAWPQQGARFGVIWHAGNKQTVVIDPRTLPGQPTALALTDVNDRGVAVGETYGNGARHTVVLRRRGTLVVLPVDRRSG